MFLYKTVVTAMIAVFLMLLVLGQSMGSTNEGLGVATVITALMVASVIGMWG